MKHDTAGQPLKRELRIKNKPHVLTIDPDGLKLTEGRRKGIEIAWHELVSGEAEWRLR